MTQEHTVQRNPRGRNRRGQYVPEKPKPPNLAPPPPPQPRRAQPSSIGQTPAQQERFAPRIFESAGPPPPVAAEEAMAAGMFSEQEVDAGATVQADEPGRPLVVESDRVLGVPGRAPAAAGVAPRPSMPPQTRRAQTRPGAQWIGGGGGGATDVVLSDQTVHRTDVQEGTVDDASMVTRANPLGPATPTGESCTCTEVGMLPTSLRGAPAWMSWCVVCGGERDGRSRPENAVRYGNARPVVERPAAVDVQGLANSVAGSVAETLTRQLGDFFDSERFDEAVRRSMERLGSGG